MINKATTHLIWADAVRVLACFLVILTHSPQPIKNLDHSLFYAINRFICLPCIPLFFILSGYLILPVTLPTKDFLNKRMKRILIPMVTWSLIGFLFVDILVDKIDFYQGIHKLLKLPFFRIEGFYWYIYTLAGLYLLAPIITYWLTACYKKDIEYYLIFWCATLLLPYLNVFLPGIYFGDGNFYNPLYYFGGFLGYMVIGFYLKTYLLNMNSKKWIKLFIIATPIICIQPLLYIINRLSGLDISTYNAYLRIDVAIMAIIIFLILREIKYSTVLKKIFTEIAPLTFGIYLVHGIVLHQLICPIIYNSSLPIEGKVITTAIITFIVCYIVIKILSLLPFKKYLIG
jgi:surface polysaccharide O-acyltransferase-like enzyme